MSLEEKVKELRQSAEEGREVDALWEAIELVARKADTASADAVKTINRSVPGLM